MQQPFCRRDLPSDESAPDVVVGRLVARVAQLEEKLYQRELQDTGAEGEAAASKLADR